MDFVLRAFADELVKVAEPDLAQAAFRDAKAETSKKPHDGAMRSLIHGGAPVKRNYLASMLIGAAATPALALLGKKLTRTLHNREVLHAMKSAKDPKVLERLKGEFHHGPLLGRSRPDLALNHRPAMTHGDLLGSTVSGSLGGSLVQMIRDRLSGSGKRD